MIEGKITPNEVLLGKLMKIESLDNFKMKYFEKWSKMMLVEKQLEEILKNC